MTSKTLYVPTVAGSWPSGATALAMTVLRVTVGVIMTVHGFQKLSDIPGTEAGFAHMGLPMPSTMVLLAIAGEFFGGLGLIVGLLTRVAALGVFCTMAVAVFFVHLPNGLLASNNGFEYPLTLLAAAFFFVAAGAGPASLDAWFGRMLPRRRRLEVATQPAVVNAVPRPAERDFDIIDEAGDESFPASDPPARPSQSLRDHVRGRERH